MVVDEPNQDQPTEEIEGEINDLIAEAQSLTDDLTSEIGGDQTASTPREAEFFESETDSEASLDLQIAHADSALEQADTELGKIQDEASGPKKTLTLPPKGQKEAAPVVPGDTTSAPSTAPTVTLPPPTPKTDAPEDGPAPAQQLVAAQVEDPPFELESARTGRLAALSAKLPLDKLSRMSRASASATCTILEMIDRPFHRVGFKTRTILGWLALVLGVAAVSLYLFVVR